jgi:hypothetical protein
MRSEVVDAPQRETEHLASVPECAPEERSSRWHVMAIRHPAGHKGGHFAAWKTRNSSPGN